MNSFKINGIDMNELIKEAQVDQDEEEIDMNDIFDWSADDYMDI